MYNSYVFEVPKNRDLCLADLTELCVSRKLRLAGENIINILTFGRNHRDHNLGASEEVGENLSPRSRYSRHPHIDLSKKGFTNQGKRSFGYSLLASWLTDSDYQPDNITSNNRKTGVNVVALVNKF